MTDDERERARLRGHEDTAERLLGPLPSGYDDYWPQPPPKPNPPQEVEVKSEPTVDPDELKRVHISAVYRWMSRGIRGVVLESVKIGGSVYTSIEALNRWAEQMTALRCPSTANSATRRNREGQIDKASRALESILRPRRTNLHT